MPVSKPRVVVIEDESDLNSAIVSFLNLSDFAADGVRSAAELDAWLFSHDCDLAVVDIGLPDRSGLAITETLRGRSRCGIVIVTARGQVDDRLLGYSTGADYYLVKPIDMRELVAVLKAVHDRLPPPRMEWQLNPLGWQLTAPNGCSVRLTRSELTVLKILVERPGSPVTRTVIGVALGYNGTDHDPRRLEIMIRRLRKKILDETNMDAPIETAHGIGYAFTSRIIAIS